MFSCVTFYFLYFSITYENINYIKHTKVPNGNNIFIFMLLVDDIFLFNDTQFIVSSRITLTTTVPAR